MPRSLQECDALIEMRAVQLVRIHLAGRKPMADPAGHNRKRDQAFDRLIAAVEERDRQRARYERNLLAISSSNTRKTLKRAGRRVRRSLKEG
jgi:hypothetical protein